MAAAATPSKRASAGQQAASSVESAFRRVLEEHGRIILAAATIATPHHQHDGGGSSPVIEWGVREANATTSDGSHITFSSFEHPCFLEMAQLLSRTATDQHHHPNGIPADKGIDAVAAKTASTVHKKINAAMRDFIVSTVARTRSGGGGTTTAAVDRAARSAVAHRAIVTASLGILRSSCAPAVPSQVSKVAAHALLTAFAAVAKSVRPKSPTADLPVDHHHHPAVAGDNNYSTTPLKNGQQVTTRRGPTGGEAARAGQGRGSGSGGGGGGIARGAGFYENGRQHQAPGSTVGSDNAFVRMSRGPLELGADCFPEAQVAAFLADATRSAEAEAEAPRAPPLIQVSAQLATRVITTFGVGAAVPSEHLLQWGRNPSVAQTLRNSVRRVADKLRQEHDWSTLSDLVREMRTWNGAAEAEQVLGVEIGQLIAASMLAGQWDAARRAVSAAAPGEPRKALARALIPAAADAHAFGVAMALIEENSLESEFPEIKEMERKRKLMALVKKPGWKMAQYVLERNSAAEPNLRVWLTRYMIELGNLPAAAHLMDHFNLHHLLPPLDPIKVEESARARAEAHLQIPLEDSRVFVVDGWDSLDYAERALRLPPRVGASVGAGAGGRGVSCVGLDVECRVHYPNDCTLLQVASSTDVFLFDLPALCTRGGGKLLNKLDWVVGSLFSNPHIVKLGFAFTNDITQLRKDWPGIAGFRSVVSHLEVGPLSNRVLGQRNGSLTQQCEAWLGKPLDKTQCTSDWGHRPLTVDQVRYAALDAHCLVGIFEEMLLEGGGKIGPSGDAPPDRWWTSSLQDLTSSRSPFKSGKSGYS